jgi:multiple sugar transport system ATP-binding protein
VETTGSATFLTLGGSTELVIAIQGRSAVKAGEVIGLDINPADMHLFDEATGIGLARQ